MRRIARSGLFLAMASTVGVAWLQGCGSDDGKVVSTRHGDGGEGGAGDETPSDGGSSSNDTAGAGNEQAGATSAVGGDGGASTGTGGGSSSGDAAGAGGEAGGPSTSWHLWVLDRSSSHLYGYAPEQLETTNGDAPAIDIELAGVPTLTSTQLAFDAQGDLWISNLDSYRFSAADLQQSGTAQVVAVLTGIGGNYTRVAFDPAGNLWRSTYTSPPLTRFDAAAVATLSTTKTQLTPNFTSTGASDYPITFDSVGNLYGGFYATEGPTTGPNFLGRYDASQLVGTGNTIDPPALSITPRYDATDLVRSPTGQLYLVNGTATLIRYSATQMAKSGLVQAIAPEQTVTVDAPGTVALNRIAIDPSGNVYLSGTSNRVLKLGADQLAKTGTFSAVPAMTLRAQAGDAAAAFQAIVVH